MTMRAHIGDQLVVESPATGTTRRDGEIVGVHHDDGTPPYDVRWSDTNDVTLVFPGPDAHIQHIEQSTEGARREAAEPVAPSDEPSHRASDEPSHQLSDEPSHRPSDEPSHWPLDPGDIGRRVAHERTRQRLTRAELADRAGLSTTYLAYVEERPANPNVATLTRLADALGITAARLRGGGADLPPGEGQAAYHPELRELGEDECWDRLAAHGVGRIAVSTPDGLAVVPVNYDVVDGAIVFRTEPGAVPAAGVGTDAAFEVDQVDEAMSGGWSVLAHGRARAVTEPDEVRRLAECAYSRPWAGGERPLWVVIEPTRLTGRRIHTD
jgi:transcriptional regulator with XRE-family HTH domain